MSKREFSRILQKSLGPNELTHFSPVFHTGISRLICWSIYCYLLCHNESDAFCNLVPFVQHKNAKNTHGGVLLLKFQSEPATLLKVALLLTFFKLYKWYRIMQSRASVLSLWQIPVQNL